MSTPSRRFRNERSQSAQAHAQGPEVIPPVPDQPSPTAATPSPGQTQGQPPLGSSPAVGPTQNKGQEVAAVKIVAVAMDGLLMAVHLVGANSESGKAILETIPKLAKLVPPGSVSREDKMKVMQSLTMAAQKQGQQMLQARPPGQPQAQPGAPPQAIPRAA